MALPTPANVTCDVYRGFNAANPYSPPNRPAALSGVGGTLLPGATAGRYGYFAGAAANAAAPLHWTNVLLVPAGTDVRSAYNSELNTYAEASGDTVLVPDYPTPGTCCAFVAVMVQRHARGTPGDHLRVYLDRARPSYGVACIDAAARPTTCAVASSLNPSTVGDSVTFTATVTNSVGDGATPTGAVEFYDGATDLGPGTGLSGSGNAATSAFTTSALTAGAHTVRAVYMPTGHFLGSQGQVTQTVNSGLSSPCYPGGTLPSTLHATFLDNLNCGCVTGGGSLALAYNSGTQQWTGTGALGSCGHNVTLAFYCGSGGTDCTGYRLDVSFPDLCASGSTGLTPDLMPACTNSPLSVPFSVLVNANCGCGMNGTFKVLITT